MPVSTSRVAGILREVPITHLLRIPLATAQSTSQLSDSIERISNDPIASALPALVWNTPHEVHINTGPLNLPTKARENAAIKLLHAMARELDQGPGVTLQGLDTRYESRSKWGLQNVMQLRCSVKDNAPFLNAFCSLVVKAFTAEGHMFVGEKGD